MDLKNIVTDRAEATISFMGEDLKFRYRPALLTMDRVAMLESATQIEDLAQFFVEVVVSWDLTENGEELKVNVENIRKLPIGIIKEMSSAMIDNKGVKDQGKASHDG